MFWIVLCIQLLEAVAGILMLAKLKELDGMIVDVVLKAGDMERDIARIDDSVMDLDISVEALERTMADLDISEDTARKAMVQMQAFNDGVSAILNYDGGGKD